MGSAIFLRDSFIATRYTWERYKNEILPAYVTNRSWDTGFYKDYRKNGFAFTFDHQLRELRYKNPVTVLTGRQDESVGCEDSWDRLKHLPKLTFVAMDDGIGHLMQIENPEAFSFHLKGQNEAPRSKLRGIKLCEQASAVDESGYQSPRKAARD